MWMWKLVKMKEGYFSKKKKKKKTITTEEHFGFGRLATCSSHSTLYTQATFNLCLRGDLDGFLSA